MSQLTNDVQIINQNGKPAFAVVPYDQYLTLINQPMDDADILIPHGVVELTILNELSLIAAWRSYKGFSQSTLATMCGMSQSGIAQIEKIDSKPQAKTLQKIATALDVNVNQLTE